MGIVSQQIDTASDTAQTPCPGPTNCRGSLGDELRAGFYGSVPGLAIGLTGSVLLRNRAPTYGRVAMIQSAALGGAFAGALAQVAFRWQPYGSGWAYTVRTVDGTNSIATGEWTAAEQRAHAAARMELHPALSPSAA